MSKNLLYICYVRLPSLLSYQMDPLPKFDVPYREFSNIFLYHFVFTFSTCYNLSGASIMNKMGFMPFTATFHHKHCRRFTIQVYRPAHSNGTVATSVLNSILWNC